MVKHFSKEYRFHLNEWNDAQEEAQHLFDAIMKLTENNKAVAILLTSYGQAIEKAAAEAEVIGEHDYMRIIREVAKAKEEEGGVLA